MSNRDEFGLLWLAAQVDIDDLDELVCEAAEKHASMINNEGISSQIDYLVSQIGVDGLRIELENLIGSEEKAA